VPKALGVPSRKSPQAATLRLSELAAYVGCSERGLRKLLNEADFPQPVMLTEATRVWLRSDVNAWLRSRRLPTQERVLLPSEEILNG
jgi:predicted DNA-binding transcriptional regulator AlpA